MKAFERPVLHGDPLREVSWLVDVAAEGDVLVGEKLKGTTSRMGRRSSGAAGVCRICVNVAAAY